MELIADAPPEIAAGMIQRYTRAQGKLFFATRRQPPAFPANTRFICELLDLALKSARIRLQ